MKKIVILLCWLTVINLAIGQNLIPNPSFEKADSEPTNRLTDKNNFTCQNWTGVFTPDYFTSTRKDFYGYAFSNDGGNQNPLHGNAYVGLGLFCPGPPTSEYLKVKLKEKLVKDGYYCLSFFINMRDKSSYAINEFDYLLSKTEPVPVTAGLVKSKDYKRIFLDTFMVDRENWVHVCSFYKSKGNEEFLTIGTFNENINWTDLYDKYTARKIIGAFYFIDSVSLVKVNNVDECKCKGQKTLDPENDKFILHNINFKENESELLPSSFKGLDSLVTYLKANPKHKIQVLGHTDNSGKEDENIKLSEMRSKTVAEYLIGKGILKTRVTNKGFGSSQPLKPNNSPANKKANRRVEFIILK